MIVWNVAQRRPNSTEVLDRSFSLHFCPSVCRAVEAVTRPPFCQRKRKEESRVLFHKCRCGALIPQGIPMCPACAEGQGGQQSRHMEYNRYRRDRKTAAFYVSDPWRSRRMLMIRLYDGMDIYAYYIQHRIETADMVHHIEPLTEAWDRRLDPLNLIPLSNQNHGVIEALYKKDDATKKRTQKELFGLIEAHWKSAGGIEKVLNGLS